MFVPSFVKIDPLVLEILMSSVYLLRYYFMHLLKDVALQLNKQSPSLKDVLCNLVKIGP